MTMYDSAAATNGSVSPARSMALLLAAALALAVIPESWTASLRRPLHAALRPGEVAATALGDAVDGSLARLRGLMSSSQRHAELERQIEALRTRNAQLEAAAIALATQTDDRADTLPPPQSTTPLVTARLIEARVIGRHLQSLLHHEATLDVGSTAGLKPGAWTLDATSCLIDQGTNADLCRGKLVLAGRRVLGKVSETTHRTSRVQHPTDSGYRDLVQLAYRQGSRISLGPRGVLEGTGEPLCRVRMIPVTESVSTGDLLLTAGSEGLAAGGLVYGEVVRVERPAGATHWEVWMRPAVSGKWPDRVAVVSASIDDAAAVVMVESDAATKEHP